VRQGLHAPVNGNHAVPNTDQAASLGGAPLDQILHDEIWIREPHPHTATLGHRSDSDDLALRCAAIYRYLLAMLDFSAPPIVSHHAGRSPHPVPPLEPRAPGAGSTKAAAMPCVKH